MYKPEGLRTGDFTLDDAHLETRCPLDNGRHHSTESRHSVGQLDVLPLEIITEILLALDLPTLTTFRRVNRRAMSLVNSLYQYSMVVKQCPNVLRAILSLNADSFDCRTLYETLSEEKCETCNQFGSYLYLITCKRVCYICFTSEVDYRPYSAASAAKTTGISRKALPKRLPCVYSLPGIYTPSAKFKKRRSLLFDRRAVRDKAKPDDPWAHHIGGVKLPLEDYPALYVSIISAPYLSSSGQSADWGVYCDACRRSGQPETHFRNKYTKDGFLDHCERYGPVTMVNERAQHG
ncbi:hypothetical protein F5Y09DRAFT_329277 [Xylaria sp. FL1042]|nr:hypothetical protein F5Y09DRAFT_329277 [Xylaria sp. FL1042]